MTRLYILLASQFAPALNNNSGDTWIV